jgi:hypothetical protein
VVAPCRSNSRNGVIFKGESIGGPGLAELR